MIAKERGRRVMGVLVTLAAVGGLGQEAVLAQGTATARRAPGRTGVGQTPPGQQTATDEKAIGQMKVVPAVIPVNPTDAIAVINNEEITRQRLADECIARKGEEILETLIHRTLIDQALRAKKLEVTAAEVDKEIDNVAHRVARLSREAWLRTLAKDRGISPIQYARDIIYPALALRKLSAGRVQVTEKDIQIAFEAQYGEKLRVRLIMTDSVNKARGIWEALRKNPGGFAVIAEQQSMDEGSRALGGLLAEPITRHAYPTSVSDAAFLQLVDGDPTDRDPAHKPKDGAISGPIQVAEATWVILRRESVIPAQTSVSPKDPKVRNQCYEMIYEVKLKEEMTFVMDELVKGSKIDNKLTGRVKEANEEQVYGQHVDGDVKLMSNPGDGAPKQGATVPAGGTVSVPPPPGAPTDEVLSKQAEALRNSPVK